MKIENVENNYFIDIDDETLELLEQQGDKCMSEALDANKSLKEVAFKILNLLIIGIGGSFILLTQMAEPNYLTYGLLVFCVGWAVAAIYIVTSCVIRKDRPLSVSDPQTAYTPVYKELNNSDYDYFYSIGYKGKKEALPIFRRYRLGTLQVAIEEMLKINNDIGNSLNKSIIWAASIPAASAAVAFFFYNVKILAIWLAAYL